MVERKKGDAKDRDKDKRESLTTNTYYLPPAKQYNPAQGTPVMKLKLKARSWWGLDFSPISIARIETRRWEALGSPAVRDPATRSQTGGFSFACNWST